MADKHTEADHGIGRRALLRTGLVGLGVAGLAASPVLTGVALADATVVLNGKSYLAQNNWLWCRNCSGLFWGSTHPAPIGNYSGGCCPLNGNPHVNGGSNYEVPHDGPQQTGVVQVNWRWCGQCSGLFWGGGVSHSVCPLSLYAAGHGYSLQHVESSSTQYDMMMGSWSSNVYTLQKYWRWCYLCEGLFWGSGGALTGGVCPANGSPYNFSHHVSGNQDTMYWLIIT